MFLAEEESDEIRNETKDTHVGIRILYDMVSNAYYNLPVVTIK